jgi:hypothetical protein
MLPRAEGVFMSCRPSKRSDAAPTELMPIFLCRSYKDFAPTELAWSIERRSHIDEYARDMAAYPSRNSELCFL